MGRTAESNRAIPVMRHYLEKSMSFADYAGLLDRLVDEGRTSGPRQSEKLAAFTRLNRQRMRRIAATVRLSPSLLEAAALSGRRRIWLVITEAWCGDAAQSLPVIQAIADATPGVTTRYVLRDETPALMDLFLTNGSRSIPKLICLDAETLDVLGTWGPRPAAAQERFEAVRATGTDKPSAMEDLQRWYNADRQAAIQREFEAFLRNCSNVPASAGM